MRPALALLCAAALVAGCGGDDDETTIVETTTVIETQTVPAPSDGETTTPTVPEEEPAEEPEDDGAAEAPRECGSLAFEANTDSGASGIEAIRADCDAARAVARAADGQSDDLVYEARGFTCNGERQDEAALARIRWICIGPDRAVVGFVTT